MKKQIQLSKFVQTVREYMATVHVPTIKQMMQQQAEKERAEVQFLAVCEDELLAHRVIGHCNKEPGGWRAIPALAQICWRGETSWEDVQQVLFECPSLIRDQRKAVTRFRYNRCPWEYFKFFLVVNGPSSTQACKAHQFSDQMCCDRCQLVWDINDQAPPNCEPWGLIQGDRNQPEVD